MVNKLNHNSQLLYIVRVRRFLSLSQIIPNCTCNSRRIGMTRISVHSGRIKKNKRGSERYVDGVALREPGVGSRVHTARALRTEMSKEEVGAANVRDASIMTLLRIRARNIRSGYESLWSFYVDGVKDPFLYDSKEGDGDENARINELRSYIAQNVRVVEDLRAKVQRSPRSKSAWKKCKKGGGSRRRMFLEREAAVAQGFVTARARRS